MGDRVNPTTLSIPENDRDFKELVLSELIHHGGQINMINRKINTLITMEIEKALAPHFRILNALIVEAQKTMEELRKANG
jgi:hypothetical protein